MQVNNELTQQDKFLFDTWIMPNVQLFINSNFAVA
jgi:hypothetical protein